MIETKVAARCWKLRVETRPYMASMVVIFSFNSTGPHILCVMPVSVASSEEKHSAEGLPACDMSETNTGTDDICAGESDGGAECVVLV